MDQKKAGSLLRELRKEKHITLEQLAETPGVSNRSVSRWENGNILPDFDLLSELAKIYQVGIDEILNGERKADKTDSLAALAGNRRIPGIYGGGHSGLGQRFSLRRNFQLWSGSGPRNTTDWAAVYQSLWHQNPSGKAETAPPGEDRRMAGACFSRVVR